MAEPTTIATPPAQGGTQIDQAALVKSITEGVAAAFSAAIAPLAASQKSMAETIAAAARPADEKKDAPAALSAADVAKLLDEKLSAHQQTATQKAQRDAYIADKLKDLPGAYRGQLGSDPAKWAAEESAIREQYKADFKAGGGKPAADVSGGEPGGQKPGETVDLSKLSPSQLIEMGIDDAPAETKA